MKAFTSDVRILNYVRNNLESQAGSVCFSDSKSQTGAERPLLKDSLKLMCTVEKFVLMN